MQVNMYILKCTLYNLNSSPISYAGRNNAILIYFFMKNDNNSFVYPLVHEIQVHKSFKKNPTQNILVLVGIFLVICKK